MHFVAVKGQEKKHGLVQQLIGMQCYKLGM